VRCILLSLPSISYLKRVGRADLLSKWVAIAIQRVELWSGPDNLEELKGDAGACLYNIGWYREAYTIVKSCVGRHDICTYIAAECLSIFG
jgi:hypothetical protein